MRKWMLCAVALLMLSVLACEVSVNLGGETPEPTTPPLVLETPSEVALPTPFPPTEVATVEAPPTGLPAGVLLEDDFSDPASGWEVGNYGEGSVGYKDGAYFVLSTVDGKQLWGVANRTFDNLIVEVEARQVSAPANDNNAYGVGCRIQPNGDGYYFYISGDGYYRIAKSAGGDHQPLVDWTSSGLINQGNSTNRLRVVCDSSHLALSVNGQLLAEAEDFTFSEGDIAFSVGTFEDDPTEVHFDNVRVTAPGASAVSTATRPVGVLFQDDFSDPSSGWEVGNYNQGSVGYRDGAYFVTSAGEKKRMWGVANRSFDNLIIEVEARQVSAPASNDNAYGVSCRVQADDDAYNLVISGDGFYAIQKIEDGSFQMLVDWTRSDVINQGNATNHLRAVCDGSRLALYCNGQLLAETTDSTYASGDIALMVTTYESEPTEVLFDNLVVRTPESR